MKKLILWSMICVISIMELILLYTAFSYFKGITSFRGHYLDMPWYEEQTTIVSSYLIFPIRYFYKHVILSIITGIFIYGGVIVYLLSRVKRKTA